MKKPNPINKESYFGIDELFFSKTNPKGVIESSNGVFIRVSKYAKDDMIGAPHSIIRHPDMPRCIFKLFWDTIKTGRPIAAYVKNMAGDGSYYWVLAAVFPVDNGYLSIRLKPSTELFKVTQTLYKELLSIEQERSMKAGEERLGSLLSENGFSSYEEFMTKALTSELRSRSEVLAKDRVSFEASVSDVEHGREVGKGFDQIENACSSISSSYAHVFRRFENFTTGSHLIRENTMKVLGSYNELGKLSINMAAAAERAGAKGLTLTVVAGFFQTLAEQIQDQLVLLRSSIENLSKTIAECEFIIASARLQSEMVQFFIKECRSIEDSYDLLENLASSAELITLANRYSTTVKKSCEELVGQLRRFSLESRELENLVLGLEVVRQSGTVEASRSYELKGSFDAHIDKMKQFIEQVKKPTAEINDSLKSLIEDARISTELILGTVTRFTEMTQVQGRLVKTLEVA